MILTNKYNASYNMENIDKDFDIFIVEKKTSKLDETNILDLATDQFKARAVQYTWGRTAFVLFDKQAVTESQYREAIAKDYPDVTVRKMDILNEEECKAFYWQKRLLAQLLLNTIRVPKQMGFSYNDLTGKLFYGEPEWRAVDRKTKKPYMLYFLEIAFDAGMYLNLNVKTFMTKQRSAKSRYYLIDPKTGNFRRKTALDPFDENLFTEASFLNKKNTVPYLDFSSFEKFKSCKLGVLERFMQDVEKHLGEYLTLEPEQREEDCTFEETRKERDNLSVSDYTGILDERGVNIVDECQDDKSRLMVARLVQELQVFYDIAAQTGPLTKNMYNIRLIHQPEYYEEKDLPDPYNEDLHGYIVQHMIEERHEGLSASVGEKASPVIRKVITELILKGDVRSEQISIYNWSKLSEGKTWSFVMREKLKDEKVPQGGIINAAGNKSFSYYRYICVQVKQDGKLIFTVFDDVELAKTEFEERIRYAYDTFYDVQKSKHQKTVEGLAFSEIDNIHAIIRTNEKTMPNTRNLWKGLKETNIKEVVLVGKVQEALNAFMDIYPENQKYAEDLKTAIVEYVPTISKKDLRKLMNMRKKVAKHFNRFLHVNYGIWVSPEIKDQEFEEDFLLENVLDIKYFEEENTDGTLEPSFNYYVGPKRNSLQSSIHNASIVRQVQAEGKLEFRELLPLMTVDFVRIGQYTVLPFPFKYLREYQKMI